MGCRLWSPFSPPDRERRVNSPALSSRGSRPSPRTLDEAVSRGNSRRATWVVPHAERPRSPGKNTGVGCHFLLQCMKVKSESEVAQWCPTLSDPMDCGPPGSSVHGILQARVLQWGAIAFSGFNAYVVTNMASFSTAFRERFSELGEVSVFNYAFPVTATETNFPSNLVLSSFSEIFLIVFSPLFLINNSELLSKS